MIGKLPKCNKETGQWDEGETIDIKLSLEWIKSDSGEKIF